MPVPFPRWRPHRISVRDPVDVGHTLDALILNVIYWEQTTSRVSGPTNQVGILRVQYNPAVYPKAKQLSPRMHVFERLQQSNAHTNCSSRLSNTTLRSA